MNPIFPILSLASLAAIGEQCNFESIIIDQSWRPYEPEFLIDLIKIHQPKFICFTALTPSINQILDTSFIIKQHFPNIILIAGGPHVSALPKTSLENSRLDIVVIGEGEETFKEILLRYPTKKINGIAYISNGQIVQTSPRSLIKDLDDLPYPAWDKYDLSLYKKHTSKLFAKKSPFVAIEFSRGCIYKCDFCASKLTLGFGYRKKSPKRCAQEFITMQKLGIREVMLTDDIFTTDKEWAKKVCRELISANTKIQWSCTNGIRVESADLELFQLMKKAGCYRVAFGFESGDDKVLKKFGKGGKANLENARIAVELAKKAKLETIGFFQIGLSSDTEQSVLNTISFARSLKLDMFKFGVTIAFPGTRMFNEYHTKKLIKSYDWDKYHIYSGHELFNHEVISSREIQRLVKKAYRETTFFSLSFLLRRTYFSIVNFTFYWEIIYFIKYLFLSYTQTKQSTKYLHQDSWNDKLENSEIDNINAI